MFGAHIKNRSNINLFFYLAPDKKTIILKSCTELVEVLRANARVADFPDTARGQKVSSLSVFHDFQPRSARLEIEELTQSGTCYNVVLYLEAHKTIFKI